MQEMSNGKIVPIFSQFYVYTYIYSPNFSTFYAEGLATLINLGMFCDTIG